MGTDLPLEAKESTPSRVPVASSDATRDPVELIPSCESDPKLQDSSEDEEDEETLKQFQRYFERMVETDGFDGGHLRPDTARYSGVILMDVDDDVEDCVDFVIREHNSNPEWGMKLELCEILKVNWSPCGGANFYITFSAIDLASEDKAPKDYEARVYLRWDGYKETGIFREKGSGSSKKVFKCNDRPGQVLW